MTDTHHPAQDIDPMVDAKQAAAALRLPHYWFAYREIRNKYRIPHYLMGNLVRFRLSELSLWAAHCSIAQSHDDQDENPYAGEAK